MNAFPILLIVAGVVSVFVCALIGSALGAFLSCVLAVLGMKELFISD